MKLELNTKEPIYIQIKRYIEMQIVSSELKEGDKMPSVREYASELKVNPNTIQRVYSELENSNLLKTQRGIGKFITKDINTIKKLRMEKSRDIFKEFIENCRLLGLDKDEIIKLINDLYKEGEDE